MSVRASQLRTFVVKEFLILIRSNHNAISTIIEVGWNKQSALTGEICGGICPPYANAVHK